MTRSEERRRQRDIGVALLVGALALGLVLVGMAFWGR